MKKYFYTILLLISLSIIIIFFGNIFDDSIMRAALRNNGVYNLEEYKIDHGKYNISIPEEWSIEENIEVNKIDICVSDGKAINIQINYFKEKGNLNKVIDNVKEDIKGKYPLKEDTENIDGSEWNVLIYKTNEGEINKYLYRQHKEGEVVVKISYLEEKYKASISRVFHEILRSFQVCEK